MATLIIESEHKLQTVRDAINRAAFNLQKNAMSTLDREQAKLLEELIIKEKTDGNHEAR